MARRVIISGLGPVSALGIGIDAHWQAVCAGRSGIGRITAFDPSGFDCQIAAEVRDFKVNSFVPKSYRKAIKVMARDIELAVAAADLAARDAGLITKGTLPPEAGDVGGGATTSYPAQRMGANIGAGLIACELDELTGALVEARKDDGSGQLDIHKWGASGMQQLTPLWLLKYLPNMLACHVTIIHDAQGPSNTITCAEASSGLSLGEAMRVLQRGAADASFCGGAESKLNPMTFLRQEMLGRLNTTSNDQPTQAVQPFIADAKGMVLGEGGGLVILEALDAFEKRNTPGKKAYAEVLGFGAAQTVHRAKRNLTPDPQGMGMQLAMRSALREAQVQAGDIDLVLPLGSGEPAYDAAEWSALQSVFGARLESETLPVVSTKPMLGNCGAAAGALDICIAAKALSEQMIPAQINVAKPQPARAAKLNHVLVTTTSLGGQNVAVVLRKM